jgi:OmpA-OmpF porin, OOP family
MNLNKTILAALLLLCSSVVMAQVPVTVTVGGTQYFWDDNRDVDNELLPSAAIEFPVTGNWAGEVSYSVGEADAIDGSQNVDIDAWHIGALRYFEPQESSLYPYVGFGGGELIRGFDNGDAVDIVFNVGAGFRYYFTDHWNWRAEARWLHTLDGHINDAAVNMGIAYSFSAPPGRGKKAMAEEPAAMAAVDSDGDGVADDMDECPNTPAGARVDSRGCKLAVTKVASVKLKVNFAFDSDDVQEHYFADLQGLADFLKRFEDMHVDIEGHTDSTGPDAYNQNLSQRRADAVRELLVNEYGIPAYRLEAKGYGESQPVASNDTKEGRAANRRVMATLEVEYDE